MVVKFARLTPSEEAFHRQLYERAARDPLTGLSNRASFLDQVGPLAERGALRGLDLAVILLDIDHFKQFNDTHGHEVGDLVLKKVAEALQQSTRPGDLVARYGGEEFVLAFLVPDASVGSQVAERVRQSIEDRRVELNGESLQVTASLGLVISHPATSRTFDQLIVSADECLYQAKRDGRNRVVREPSPSQGSTCDFRPA
jgi:diguanylate cyclase (GGDEF)-like protein